MKTRSALWIAAILISAATPCLSQQLSTEQASAQHGRYRLVQIGTFGGRDSIYQAFTRIAADSGIVVGAANTSTPDPNAPVCFDSPFNCFVLHGWKWTDGVLTDLGALPGGSSSYTNAVNSRGLVVGQSEDGGVDPLTGNARFVATLWDHGQIKNLGTFGGISFAIAITNQNFVMGASENGIVDTSGFAAVAGITQISQIRAFAWNGADIFDLGTLGGTGAFPLDMNNRGQVVGLSPTTFVPGPLGLQIDAFLWSGGTMHDLGTLGGTFSAANAINDRGQVAGVSNLAGDSAAHAFLWQNGTMTDLGAIGGTFTSANWLNDAGEVIGIGSTTGDTALHAFVWRHNKISDLGTVAGDNNSSANSINNKGQVVGGSWFWDGQQTTALHAFLWEGEGPSVDLSTLITNPTDLSLNEASFITDRGWIIVNGTLPNGDVRVGILIPEGDAENLNLPTTAQNGEPTVKPVPPQPAKLSAVTKQWLPRDYRSQSLAKYSTQLHGYQRQKK